jgi:hypothetical protein
MTSAEVIAACAVLGLTETATLSEARAAYRSRAALLHPDVHQGRSADAQREANVAMQQLNAAYQVVVRHLNDGAAEHAPRSGDSGAGNAGVSWRCPTCTASFTSTSDIPTCPVCGQRLRRRPASSADAGGDSAQRPGSRSEDRAGSTSAEVGVIYEVAGWSRQQRNALARVLHLFQVPFAWDSDEVVIHKRYEPIADRLIAAFDAREQADAGGASQDREVLYSVGDRGLETTVALSTALELLHVPHVWEAGELVVDKRYEDVVDPLVEALDHM